MEVSMNFQTVKEVQSDILLKRVTDHLAKNLNEQVNLLQ